jgi:uncharacterized protein (DUF58 family)
MRSTVAAAVETLAAPEFGSKWAKIRIDRRAEVLVYPGLEPAAEKQQQQQQEQDQEQKLADEDPAADGQDQEDEE